MEWRTSRNIHWNLFKRFPRENFIEVSKGFTQVQIIVGKIYTFLF